METFVCRAYIVNIMGTISARVPDELEAAFEEYVAEEDLDRSTAVRKLLAGGLDDWRKERALSRLADGDISFSKAAEIADVSIWEFARLAKERDVGWVSGAYLAEDLEAL